MSFTFTWLGHGSMSLDVNGTTILVDPFLTDNPSAAAKAEDLSRFHPGIPPSWGSHWRLTRHSKAHQRPSNLQLRSINLVPESGN